MSEMRAMVTKDLVQMLLTAQMELDAAQARLVLSTQVALAAVALPGHTLVGIDTKTNELIVALPQPAGEG